MCVGVWAGRSPTFHGVLEEEVVDVGDGGAVRLLRSQVEHPLDEVVHHPVHVVREDGDVSGTHDELPEDAAHLQPVLALTVKQARQTPIILSALIKPEEFPVSS